MTGRQGFAFHLSDLVNWSRSIAGTISTLNALVRVGIVVCSVSVLLPKELFQKLNNSATWYLVPILFFLVRVAYLGRSSGYFTSES